MIYGDILQIWLFECLAQIWGPINAEFIVKTKHISICKKWMTDFAPGFRIDDDFTNEKKIGLTFIPSRPGGPYNKSK